MALTLLRHAPLPPQHQGRYNGWRDLPIDPSLFDTRAIAPLQEQHFEHIYSSDLLRCTQTLDAIGLEHYQTDSRLREVRFKPHIEGKCFEEITHLPDYDTALLEDHLRWHRYICDESPAAFEGRIRAFLSELPKEREILICSHAGTLLQMLALLGRDKEKIDYLEYQRLENVL